MKRSLLSWIATSLSLPLVALLMIACGSSTGTDDGTGRGTTGGPAAAVNLTADSLAVNPGGTTAIRAAVFDDSGAAVGGTTVLFTLDNPALGFVTRSAVTDGAGVATALFTARGQGGEVNCTATAETGTVAVQKLVIREATAPATMAVIVNPSSVIATGGATVTAEVRDIAGEPVPNGTLVHFNLVNSASGSITATATTNSGVATATFEASSLTGNAVIEVNTGSVNTSITVSVEQAPAATIEFSGVDFQVIALAGSGGPAKPENTDLRFTVKDANGDPVKSREVSFQLEGPIGAYIDLSGDGTPLTLDTPTNAGGIASVTLHSGTQMGTATVIASIVDDNDMIRFVRSSVVSIGGGVPSAKWFSLAATVRNVPGLNLNGATTAITASLADRFGNFNILEGTTVSFFPESGLALDDVSRTLLRDGLATVTARTQGGGPEDVIPQPWEIDLQNHMLTTYGQRFTGHPRDGLATILAYAKGEEHFNDSNANGMYDIGETFVDTTADPFCDYNDNGLYDGPSSPDPEEWYTSADNSGIYNGATNGLWDPDKYLHDRVQVLVTGPPLILSATSTFAVLNGKCETITIAVCDRNINPLTADSSVEISTDTGKLGGLVKGRFPNEAIIGQDAASHAQLIEFPVQICDDDPRTDLETPATITITVTWKDGEGDRPLTKIITGTVN